MEPATLSHDGAAVASLAGAPAPSAVSSVVQTIGSIPDNADPLSNLPESKKSDLHKVASTDAECKDNGETNDDSDEEDDDDSDEDDAAFSSGEDDDDDDDDEEDDTDSDSDDDDDEDSDDDDDDEDSDEDDDDEDSDEDDDDEDNQPPCKKNN